jgi:hypothetical protein
MAIALTWEGLVRGPETELVAGAYAALVNGYIEPLVTLFDETLHWRGVERGALWWRKAPY